MKRRLFALMILFAFVTTVLISSQKSPLLAKGDTILEEIEKYRDWNQIHKPDENIVTGVFKITDSSVAG